MVVCYIKISFFSEIFEFLILSWFGLMVVLLNIQSSELLNSKMAREKTKKNILSRNDVSDKVDNRLNTKSFLLRDFASQKLVIN